MANSLFSGDYLVPWIKGVYLKKKCMKWMDLKGNCIGLLMYLNGKGNSIIHVGSAVLMFKR
jgi:hypothetical protein